MTVTLTKGRRRGGRNAAGKRRTAYPPPPTTRLLAAVHFDASYFATCRLRTHMLIGAFVPAARSAGAGGPRGAASSGGCVRGGAGGAAARLRPCGGCARQCARTVAGRARGTDGGRPARGAPRDPAEADGYDAQRPARGEAQPRGAAAAAGGGDQAAPAGALRGGAFRGEDAGAAAAVRPGALTPRRFVGDLSSQFAIAPRGLCVLPLSARCLGAPLLHGRFACRPILWTPLFLRCCVLCRSGRPTAPAAR